MTMGHPTPAGRDILDLTVPIGPDMAVYPGDPHPEQRLVSDLARGDPVTASVLTLGAHVGTHVDLPAHFIRGGKTLGDYPIDAFVGPAHVLDLTDVAHAVDRSRLAGETIPEDRHLLLKTRNSSFVQDAAFREDYVFLDPSATAHLLAANPRSIGIDYYSLDPAGSDGFPSHRLCAARGLPVFVCLDLSAVTPGSFGFAGLPLNLARLEGAPVRAMLWRE